MKGQDRISSNSCWSDRLTGLIRNNSLAAVTRNPRSRPAVRRLWSSESGQVAILTALLMTVLLSVGALVVDTGTAYKGRRDLQNAADAAALAGVMEIAEDRGTAAAESSALDYVAKNLGDALGATTVSFPQAGQVKVEIAASRDTYFARIFGVESVSVRASATAASGLAGEVSHLMPLIVPRQRVFGHVGPENAAVFELGEDRPLEALSIINEINGNQVQYTVTYVNTSNRAVDLEMWSPIPVGAEYVSGSATGGGGIDGPNVRWAYPGIAAGDSRLAAFTVSFAGPVDPTNVVYVTEDGGPVRSATTGGPQLGFFWLTDFDTGSGGTPDFADWIINGYPNPVGLGDLANGTGVRAALMSAMEARIARDPSVVLPLYSFTQGGGHQGEYVVVGFAEFIITDFSFTGNPKQVSGYFTNGTVTPGAGGGSPVDHGVKAIWLSE